MAHLASVSVSALDDRSAHRQTSRTAPSGGGHSNSHISRSMGCVGVGVDVSSSLPSPSGKHNENDMHGKRLRRGSSYYAVLLVTAARERATALRKAAACGLVNTPQLHSLSDEPY
mmetsp:Transcript_34875/g.104176  ORF Transcript_34875/g.104176 Transcript_34875/m.104176 type:complete len:115 (+) Transcript_34875:23-367(+)